MMPNVSFPKTPACRYMAALGVFVSLFRLDLCLAQSNRDTSPSVELKSLTDLRSSLLSEIDSLKVNPSWLVAEVDDRVSSKVRSGTGTLFSDPQLAEPLRYLPRNHEVRVLSIAKRQDGEYSAYVEDDQSRGWLLIDLLSVRRKIKPLIAVAETLYSEKYREIRRLEGRILQLDQRLEELESSSADKIRPKPRELIITRSNVHESSSKPRSATTTKTNRQLAADTNLPQQENSGPDSLLNEGLDDLSAQPSQRELWILIISVTLGIPLVIVVSMSALSGIQRYKSRKYRAQDPISWADDEVSKLTAPPNETSPGKAVKSYIDNYLKIYDDLLHDHLVSADPGKLNALYDEKVDFLFETYMVRHCQDLVSRWQGLQPWIQSNWRIKSCSECDSVYWFVERISRDLTNPVLHITCASGHGTTTTLRSKDLASGWESHVEDISVLLHERERLLEATQGIQFWSHHDKYLTFPLN